MRFVIPLRALGPRDVPRVGGKAANLGVLLSGLESAGVRVPDGFVVTADAFRAHLDAAGLAEPVARELAAVDEHDVAALARVAGGIRSRIRSASLPGEVVAELAAAYDAMAREPGGHDGDADVAVRSSSTAEDLPHASFAGQYDTCLHVRGRAALIDAVRACMASLYTDRAIVYRRARGFADHDVALAVCVQHMVRSDLGAAGVIYTLDPSTGFRDVIELSAAWGLGVAVVQGRVEPDTFVIHKPTLAAGYPAIVDRAVGDKALRIGYADGGGTTAVEVADADRRRPAIDDGDALALARWAVAIEAHYRRPMDIEWAKDGRTGALYVVQARPETGHAARARATVEIYRRTGEGETVVTGKSVGLAIAHGRARVITDAASRAAFQPGEVVVAPRSDPDWEPLLARAAAVVLEHGGRTSHAAMVARELDVPCVVDAHDAMRAIRTGDEVTVSCAEGVTGRVLAGRVSYVREAIDPTSLPAPPLPVTLDLGEPGDAFALGLLPAAGVGRLRTELAIAAVGVHPMALVHPDRVSDPHEHAELAERIAGLASPGELLVARLTATIARVAAAFYPRPVVVRFSDFKSHEYAGLLGGRDFEPIHEPNPMLGFRGAARYHDPRYRAGFELECAAIRRVRDQLGLTNVALMVPFCRTIDDARRVLDVLAGAGLRRGDAGLEVHLVCEIPNCVVLADALAALCDGFAIDADLAQLVLGVDRDSALIGELADEGDPGVRAMIAALIEAAHAHGRPVAYCGRAAGDDPAYVRELTALGIDSIAVAPEAWPRIVDHLARTAPRRPRRRRALDRAIRALRRARRG